jgi:hypothetical protein
MSHLPHYVGIELIVGDVVRDPIKEMDWVPPWRVLLSHTSELRAIPPDRSFVAAAEAGVARAGDAVVDMAYMAPSNSSPAECCARMVRRADVYVGIIGARYGSLVPSRNISYTEFEFEIASMIGLPRLIFHIMTGTPGVYPCTQSPRDKAHQEAFCRRLQTASGLTVGWVASPSDLELQVFQALIELRRHR